MTLGNYFTFGNFNSFDHDWWLTTRQAPTPSEKLVTEDIPYAQGVLDLSTLTGERIYEDRTVTYTMTCNGSDYIDFHQTESVLKRQLMSQGNQALYDDFNPSFHFIGKCQSVTVDNDPATDLMTATIAFDCYPFAIATDSAGSDIWDDVYFPDWIFQDTSYQINGSQSVDLFNIGDRPVEPKVIVTGSITVTGSFGSLQFSAGTYTDLPFVLSVGENELTLVGNGSIDFEFNREVMI